jgi:hypothetical protein
MSIVLTNSKRRACIRVLKATKRSLESLPVCHPIGLCHSIRDLDCPSGISYETWEWAKTHMKNWVSKQLGWSGWIHEWGRKHGHFKYTTSMGRDRGLRATRLAWLDWMISELEAGR